MYNKESCKSCGSHLTPVSFCKVCKEQISWVCDRCEGMSDVTHSHTQTIVTE